MNKIRFLNSPQFKRNCLFPIAFILIGLAISSSTSAFEKESDRNECRLISKSDAIDRARGRLSGKVVGVQLSKNGSRSTYRVRILVDNKRVKTISIRACR